jgi:hypothetical protein
LYPKADRGAAKATEATEQENRVKKDKNVSLVTNYMTKKVEKFR